MVEAIFQRVGICEFKMINKVMYINGKRIVFRGVNRHEFSEKYGRSVTKEEMEWELEAMILWEHILKNASKSQLIKIMSLVS